MKRNVTKRVFECPDCLTKHIAYKKSNHKTKTNHIKTMYCWKCKAVKDLIQLPNYYC